MHCWGERKLVQPLWKTVWTLPKKLNLPLDPAIPLLGIYPRETKTLTQKGTCRMVFQRPSLLSPRSTGFPVPDLNLLSQFIGLSPRSAGFPVPDLNLISQFIGLSSASKLNLDSMERRNTKRCRDGLTRRDIIVKTERTKGIKNKPETQTVFHAWGL